MERGRWCRAQAAGLVRVVLCRRTPAAVHHVARAFANFASACAFPPAAPSSPRAGCGVAVQHLRHGAAARLHHLPAAVPIGLEVLRQLQLPLVVVSVQEQRPACWRSGGERCRGDLVHECMVEQQEAAMAAEGRLPNLAGSPGVVIWTLACPASVPGIPVSCYMRGPYIRPCPVSLSCILVVSDCYLLTVISIGLVATLRLGRTLPVLHGVQHTLSPLATLRSSLSVCLVG